LLFLKKFTFSIQIDERISGKKIGKLLVFPKPEKSFVAMAA